jgi:hypothetical protein
MLPSNSIHPLWQYTSLYAFCAFPIADECGCNSLRTTFALSFLFKWNIKITKSTTAQFLLKAAKQVMNILNSLLQSDNQNKVPIA